MTEFIASAMFSSCYAAKL